MDDASKTLFTEFIWKTTDQLCLRLADFFIFIFIFIINLMRSEHSTSHLSCMVLKYGS